MTAVLGVFTTKVGQNRNHILAGCFTVDGDDVTPEILHYHAGIKIDKSADVSSALLMPISDQTHQRFHNFIDHVLPQYHFDFGEGNIGTGRTLRKTTDEQTGETKPLIRTTCSHLVFSMMFSHMGLDIQKLPSFKLPFYNLYRVRSSHYGKGMGKMIDGQKIIATLSNGPVSVRRSDDMPVLTAEIDFKKEEPTLFTAPEAIAKAIKHAATMDKTIEAHIGVKPKTMIERDVPITPDVV